MLILGSGCVATKHLKPGCYNARNDNIMVDFYLQLRPDSSYFYAMTGDIDRLNQDGHWTIQRNQLILNSYIQPETVGHYVAGTFDTESQTEFMLFDINGKPLYDKNHV